LCAKRGADSKFLAALIDEISVFTRWALQIWTCKSRLRRYFVKTCSSS
jgi:hypothetical protein